MNVGWIRCCFGDRFEKLADQFAVGKLLQRRESAPPLAAARKRL